MVVRPPSTGSPTAVVPPRRYRIRAEIVAACLAELRKLRIHPNFAGYLCLRRTAARDNTLTHLRPDFKEFFETFLRVPGAPLNKPYAIPFLESAPSERNRWSNPNVAGSYSPSSFRADKPFSKVVNVEGNRLTARYSVYVEHREKALELFLHSAKIPIVPLAVFLYRDYAIEKDEPTTGDLVAILSEEFGIRVPGEDDVLFTDDSAAHPRPDWFEVVP
jgi:hypothetical protein